MAERLYNHDHADSSRHESRYDVLRPQFKQPERPVAHRDRYRTTRYDDPMYDTVEDTGADHLDFQLDSFGTSISLVVQGLTNSNIAQMIVCFGECILPGSAKLCKAKGGCR